MLRSASNASRWSCAGRIAQHTARPHIRRLPGEIVPKHGVIFPRRVFQTSSRRSIAPLLGLMVVPRIVTTAATRIVRRFIWPRLSLRTRAILKRLLLASGGLLYVGGSVYAWKHMDIIEETGRRRVLMVSEGERLYLIETMKVALLAGFIDDDATILMDDHPLYRRIQRVVNNLIKTDSRARKHIWQLVVVDSPVVNAMSFLGGYIVIYTGVLEVVKDDNDLAVLLGHELAHTILQHQEESISRQKLLSLISFPITVVINIFTGLSMALLLMTAEKSVSNYVFNMPHSRAQEAEADHLGMIMAAKACYNVERAPQFFARLSKVAGADELDGLEWMSTHPTGKHRQESLLASMDYIQGLAKDGCSGYSAKVLAAWRRTIKATIRQSDIASQPAPSGAPTVSVKQITPPSKQAPAMPTPQPSSSTTTAKVATA